MQTLFTVKQRLEQPESVKLVRRLLEADPQPSRCGLAKDLCRRLGLRDPKGDWQVAGTAKALRELEAQGLWTLPEPRSRHRGPQSPTRLGKRVPPPTAVPEVLSEIRGLRLVVVDDPEHLALWNELILREHPLRECRLVGRTLRYLIASDHGWLGALGYGSAALRLAPRDQWIGWNDEQRHQYLERVLAMTRFLIRPQVRCPNLASHVLALAADCVPEDFQRRYHLRPWLLESFVQTPKYDGASYQAANWVCVGQTQGRGRNGPHGAGKSIKDIYLYGLVDDLHQRLGVDRFPWSALSPQSGLDAQGWTEQEFGAAPLGDATLTRRLVEITRQKAARPGASYSEACGGNAHALKAYYRFLNPKHRAVSPEQILQAHRTQTLRRMKGQKVVLAPQDSCELNFSTRAACEGLGQIGTNQTGALSRGLRLHSALALDAEGLPLGVLHLHGDAPESAKGKDPDRPIQEKESYRWLQVYEELCGLAELLPRTQIVCIGDRESDIFELFDHRRQRRGRKADLLVRAQCNRSLEGTERKLFEELAAMPLGPWVKIAVPRQREHLPKGSDPGRPGLPAREARVQLGFQELTIRAPEKPSTRHRPPLKLWALYVVEPHPPQGAEAIAWRLLTTIPLTSAKQARKCLRWYCRRWRIEEWHRVLKSGCHILKHQNQSEAALMRVIVMDAVIAWRIMLLALLGRELPELPAPLVFNRWECQMLDLLAGQTGADGGAVKKNSA
jgi:Druantia protein DruA/Transposase DNA-binding